MQLNRKLLLFFSAIALSASCPFFLSFHSPATAQEARPADGEYRVTAIIDGDTIRVANPKGGRDIKVHLACIDAPGRAETQTPEGLKAQQRLTQLLQQENMRVQLNFSRQDQYQRWLADVRVSGGTLVQEVLIKEKLARFWSKDPSHCPNTFDVLQNAAGFSGR